MLLGRHGGSRARPCPGLSDAHHTFIKRCEPGSSTSRSTPAVQRTMIGLYVAGQADGRRRLRVVESEQTQAPLHHSSSISRTAAKLSALSRSSSSLPGNATSPASTSRTGAAASPSTVRPPPTGPPPSTSALPTAAVAAYMAPEQLSQLVRGDGHKEENKVLRKEECGDHGCRIPSMFLRRPSPNRRLAAAPAPHNLGEGLEARSRRMVCPATV